MFAESFLKTSSSPLLAADTRFAGGIFAAMDGLWGAP
jgi:hypothetical protein